MIRTLNFHTDPGHGWLEVDRRELESMGIDTDISHYSYQHKNKVYLEEDCDAGKYLKELDKNGVKYRFNEKYQANTPIRNYESYSPAAVITKDAFADLFARV